jgi:hypothetical protein
MEWTMEYYTSSNGKPLWLDRKDLNRIAFNKRSGLLADTRFDEYNERGAVTGDFRLVQLFNEDYHADLTAAKNGQGWLLKKVERGEDHLKMIKHTTALPWLRLYAGSVSVPELLRDSRTVLGRSEPIADGSGGTTLRVHFTSDEPGYFKTGYIDFDPRRFHRITGYAWHMKTILSEGDAKGTVEYASGEGIPVAKTMTAESPALVNKKRGLLALKYVEAYDVKYNVDVPDSEFRLTAFDLPEPVGVAPPERPRTWLWVTGAALGFALLGVLFTRLKHRAAARTKTPTPAHRSLS